MSSKENKDQKKEERITRLANKKIDFMEQKSINKVGKEEIVKAFNKAENFVEKKEKEKNKKRKFRNAIIAILGALGIAVGGHAMLPSGNTKGSNINVTEEKKTKNDFREDIKVEQKQEENTQEQEKNELTLIDEILDKYNSKIADENKIDKTDLRNNITKQYGRRKCYRKSFK